MSRRNWLKRNILKGSLNFLKFHVAKYISALSKLREQMHAVSSFEDSSKQSFLRSRLFPVLSWTLLIYSGKLLPRHIFHPWVFLQIFPLEIICRTQGCLAEKPNFLDSGKISKLSCVQWIQIVSNFNAAKHKLINKNANSTNSTRERRGPGCIAPRRVIWSSEHGASHGMQAIA